jgi:hypothetical protein
MFGAINDNYVSQHVVVFGLINSAYIEAGVFFMYITLPYKLKY